MHIFSLVPSFEVLLVEKLEELCKTGSGLGTRLVHLVWKAVLD